MKKQLLILFVAVATLVGCGKDGEKEPESPYKSSIVGTWSTSEDTEQITSVFGNDKSLIVTINVDGKTVSVQTYSYFVEGNKLTTVFIEDTPSSGRKMGEIETEKISIKGDKLYMGELVYTKVK